MPFAGGAIRSLDTSWKTVIKNALANVAGGSSSAVVALVVTPFLTRRLEPDTYSAWAVILQLSAYVGYLDFGIQTAVGRFVSFTTEKRNRTERDQIVSTSVGLLAISMVLAILALLAMAWAAPSFFREMPAALHFDVRLALLIVGTSLAIGLPFSTLNAVFVGLQRNEVPAAVIGLSRVIAAIATISIVLLRGNLVVMATAVGAVNLASYWAQYLLYRRLVTDVTISHVLVSKSAGRQIVGYAFSLSVWYFATLLVTGLDTAIVGAFDFHSVGYYATAATLIGFILGLQNAIFRSLISAAAVLAARDAREELGQMLLSSTRYGMLILLASSVPLLIFGHSILRLWVGEMYAAHTLPILRVLVVANIVRLSAVPYAMLLLGTGQQRLVILTPLIEGFSNLIASIVLASKLGAIGVAYGTLIGSCIGILCNFAYNMPRSTLISFRRVTYLKDAIIRPLLCAVPFLLFLDERFIQKMGSAAVIFTAALLIAIMLVWQLGFSSPERRQLLAYVSRRQ